VVRHYYSLDNANPKTDLLLFFFCFFIGNRNMKQQFEREIKTRPLTIEEKQALLDEAIFPIIDDPSFIWSLSC
jgi:hypothetical protein